MTVSSRVAAILSLVPPVETAAEVAADHGQIAALMVQRGLCARVIATDISAASLQKARRLFMRLHLADQGDLRVGDGLSVLAPGEAGVIVIAGLGGLSIASILEAGKAQLACGTALVLQPRPDPPSLRRWLSRNGFAITAESLAMDGGRYYVTMRACADANAAPLDEAAALLGPCLLRERPEGWAQYLRWRLDCLGAAGAEASGPAAVIRRALREA